MPDYVDLHSHSTASDGTLPPAELVRAARQCGLVGLSLTDHDTIGGVVEAANEARSVGITFIPGIEISCECPKPGTMHLLGYGVDPQSPVLLEMTRQLVEFRDNRNPRIVARLNELGVHVSMDEWQAEAGGEVLGRPHLAAILVRKGYVSSTKHAFDKYLGQGGAAYFDKQRIEPRRAISLIHQAGGLAVLAHPIQLRYSNDAQLERIVKDLVDIGLDGIEILHSDHDRKLVEQYTELAGRWRLLRTGGSDFHGANKKDVKLGLANGMRIGREMMDAMLERLGGPRSSPSPL